MTKTLRQICLFVVLLQASLALAMSVEEEIELGKAEHKKIVGQFGVYKDETLQEYVTRVGNRVAAVSSRPELEYHFTILDSPDINAFALPGGYIYITRGILTHMNSEGELAAVLGHEIAHVTEKHAIARKNTQKGVELLNAVASAVAQYQLGQVAGQGLGSLGEMFGGVLVRGYGREQELEADGVGARYMAQAGYDPEAMLRTIEILKNKDRIEIEQARLEKREPKVYHGFLSTHPDHDTRYKVAIRESAALIALQDEFIEEDEFMEKLNGMVYGSSRKVGVVRKHNFYHKRLGIKLRFPDNWRMEPTRNGVQVFSQAGDAWFFISTSRMGKDATPESHVKVDLGYDVREGRNITIAGNPAYLGIANRAETLYGPRPLRFAIIFDTKRRVVYELYGAGKHDLRKLANDQEYIATIFSFDRMSKDDFKKAIDPALQIVRAEPGTTMESLAESSPITNYALDKLRVMNGLYPNGQPEPGQLIKIVE